MTEPGSAEWELEVSRQDFNMAGQLVNELQRRLDEAVEGLVRAAEYLGKAQARYDDEVPSERHQVRDRGGWATCSCGFTPRDVSDPREAFSLVDLHIRKVNHEA